MKSILSFLQGLVFLLALALFASPYINESISMDFGDWMLIVAVAVLGISALEIAKKKIDPSHELGQGKGIRIMSVVLLLPVLFCALLLVVFLML